MTDRDREMFEKYLMDDEWYLKHLCFDEAEACELERELAYNRDTWLFEKPVNYELEDDYTEDSMP